MVVDCIADLHGFETELPGGDLLILAGDYTAAAKIAQLGKCFSCVKKQPYEKKILTAGNHDGFFESGFPKSQKEAEDLKDVQHFLIDQKEMTETDFEYLCDSGTEYQGLKIWGTPWTPWFKGVHPKCKAFMNSESHLEKRFNLIPEGLDILISHGPMRHVLDQNMDGYACGSSSLREALERAKPRFMVFGHIHEQGGNQLMFKRSGPNTLCVNCSYVDENY